MTRDKIQQRIEEAANRFADTKDEHYKHEVVRLTLRLAELRNIDVLTCAVPRCRNEDIRTPEVNHALDFLQSRATDNEPFAQFRNALTSAGNKETRYQVLKTSLNAIRQALGLT